MNMKSILLGTAAGLMVASGAYAADLPGEPAPAAVDYVKVCDAFGAGFFYIPGTQTCLDISGRVRATVRYQTNAIDTNGDDVVDDAQFSLKADARVDFDARTASDLGTVRSFFRLTSNSDKSVSVDAAYIQVGMLTVGYAGTIFNGDRLYGIDDAGNGLSDRFVAQVTASDLGGGFWVGAGIGGVADSLSTSLNSSTGDWTTPLFEGAVGISGQSWGDAALYGFYSPDNEILGGDRKLYDYGIKALANLKIADGVKARLSANYYNDDDAGGSDLIGVGAAVAYAATDAATVYAGVAYDIVDGPDTVAANIGVDYTLAEGLVATGEVSYTDVGGDNGDSFSAIARLTRTW